MDLLDTIEDYIRSNGGRHVLADLIVSENRSIFAQRYHKSVRNLRIRGIISYKDIKPMAKRSPQLTMDKSHIIIGMYPHFTYDEISRICDLKFGDVRYCIRRLIKQGKLTKKTKYGDHREKSFLL